MADDKKTTPDTTSITNEIFKPLPMSTETRGDSSVSKATLQMQRVVEYLQRTTFTDNNSRGSNDNDKE